MLQITNKNFKIIKDNRNYILYILKKNKKKEGEDLKLIGYYSSVLSALNGMVKDKKYSKLIDKAIVNEYKRALKKSTSFLNIIDESLIKFNDFKL